MTQQLHVAGLPQAIEDGYFDTTNANKSSVRVHGGQSSEFPIYPTTLERTIIPLWLRVCYVCVTCVYVRTRMRARACVMCFQYTIIIFDPD